MLTFLARHRDAHHMLIWTAEMKIICWFGLQRCTSSADLDWRVTHHLLIWTAELHIICWFGLQRRKSSADLDWCDEHHLLIWTAGMHIICWSGLQRCTSSADLYCRDKLISLAHLLTLQRSVLFLYVVMCRNFLDPFSCGFSSTYVAISCIWLMILCCPNNYA